MKIGILGTRGIPNAYGGFEQFAQFLAKGLSEVGHQVYVYNSSNHPYKEDKWGEVNIVHCPDWEDRIGTAGQFIYDLNCIIDSRKRNFDILLQLGYTSNSIWYWLWPSKSINIINMDGLEWKRTKYSKLTRKFLRFAERLAARRADVLISDSIGIQEYLIKKYNKESVYIPYGAEVPVTTNILILERWALNAYKYYLLIARLEPENNIEMIIKGYLESRRSYPLIIVGSASNKFGQYLVKNYESGDIRFIGAVYDQEVVNNLRFYSAIYFHGHSVGGTNPSLLEAMACGCTIAAHDNVFNKAILQEEARYFAEPEDVKDIINAKLNDDILRKNTDANIRKVQTLYSWNKVINDYEEIFTRSMQKV